MVLPLLKLGTLALKTLSKPLGNRLKKQAALHPRFRQFIINVAQVFVIYLCTCFLFSCSLPNRLRFVLDFCSWVLDCLVVVDYYLLICIRSCVLELVLFVANSHGLLSSFPPDRLVLIIYLCVNFSSSSCACSVRKLFKCVPCQMKLTKTLVPYNNESSS